MTRKYSSRARDRQHNSHDSYSDSSFEKSPGLLDVILHCTGADCGGTGRDRYDRYRYEDDYYYDYPARGYHDDDYDYKGGTHMDRVGYIRRSYDSDYSDYSDYSKDKKKSKSGKRSSDKKRSKEKSRSKKDKKKKDSKEKAKNKSVVKASDEEIDDTKLQSNTEKTDELKEIEPRTGPSDKATKYTLDQLSEQVASVFSKSMPNLNNMPHAQQQSPVANQLLNMGMSSPSLLQPTASLQQIGSQLFGQIQPSFDHSYSSPNNSIRLMNATSPYMFNQRQANGQTMYANQFNPQRNDYLRQVSQQALSGIPGQPIQSPLDFHNFQTQPTEQHHALSNVQPEIKSLHRDATRIIKVPSTIEPCYESDGAISALTMMKIGRSSTKDRMKMKRDRGVGTQRNMSLGNNNILLENGLAEASIPPGDMSIVLSSTPDGLTVESLSQRSIAKDILQKGDRIVALDGVTVCITIEIVYFRCHFFII